jgi:hypothetical protein
LRRRLLSTTVALLSLAVVTGCGGGASDNGVASKSPDEILAAAKSAALGAKTVHLSGTFVAEGAPLSLDLQLVNGEGAKGHITQHGLSFALIDVGGEVYIYGTPAFYRHFGGNAAAQLFNGKWLKAPTSSGEFASLSSLTEMNALLNTLLSSHGELKPAGTAVIEGQKAVGVTESAKGGTLYVATTGKPYPVAVVKSGSSGGRIVFKEWDAPVTLTPPPNAVDITQLQHA